MPEDRKEQTARQPDGLHARGVLWGAAAIVLAIALAVLIARLAWLHWEVPGGPNARTLPAVAAPVLQSAPRQERAAYFAEKQSLLESWEWIDRQKGIARIPIEEAMRLMAARTETAGEQP